MALWIGLGLCPAFAQVAVLHIQVIEGEGAVHQPGTRSLRPLTVEITDETGKPVAGAAVSFHLPEEGPGGTFGNQLRTDVVITDASGRASLRGLQVNHTPGRFQIRIVAVKEQARAGAISSQYIAEAVTARGSAARAVASKGSAPSGATASRGRLKWIVMAVLAGGGAAAGALLVGRSGGRTKSSTAPATPSIGTPTVTVGKP